MAVLVRHDGWFRSDRAKITIWSITATSKAIAPLKAHSTELRERLRHMSDQVLKHFGAPARYTCSPRANAGKPPREVFVVQLEEAIAVWRRRHSANPMVTS